MDCEDFTGGQSSKGRAFSHIHILVVDDDPLCLTITESMLRKHNYGVVTVNHPVEALSTLQLQKGLFNLVITDIYMPEMNGFELLERIKREFRLPVVMMSADNKDTVIIRSLEIGASFYLVKPINANDLKNLWQFAINSNETHSAIDRVGRFIDASCVGKPYHEGDSILSVNEGFRQNENLKREAKGKKKVHEEKEKRRDNSNSFKKEKLNWTFALHNRFVEAIRIIGYKKAVPKNILKVMNVPGLTRNNVASHLQKYRIFLSKVASSSSITSAPKGTIDRALKTNFGSGISMSIFKNSHKGSPQLSERKQMMTLPNPSFQMGPNGFTNQETSSSTFSQRLGYGQPQISYKQTTAQKNPFHHAINIGGTRNIELLNGFNSIPNLRYNNNSNLRHQNPGLQMGFSGAGTSDGDHDINSLMIRNHNGNMSSTPPMSAVNLSNSGQDVFSGFGLVSENQWPPTSSNLIQPKNTVAHPIPPLPVPLCQQESGVEVRGGDNNNLLNQMVDTCLHQPFSKDNLDDDFLKWVNDQPIDQKEGGQEQFMDPNFSIFLSGAEEDSLQEAQLNHNQQQGRQGALDPTFFSDSCGIKGGLQEAQDIHNQQDCEKETANPSLINSEFELDDDFFQFDQIFNQHQGDKEMTCPALYIQDFQQDEFFPRFDQTPNKEQTHVEIINSKVGGTYHFNKNSSEDHSCPDQDDLQVILESFSGSGHSSEDNNCLGWF